MKDPVCHYMECCRHSPQLSAPYEDCLCWRGPPHSRQGSLCKWYIEGMLAGKICKGGMEEWARRSRDAGSAEVYPWSGNLGAWIVPQRCLPLRRSPGFFTLMSGSHWLWAALSWGRGWQGVDLPSISRWSSFLGQEKVQLRALSSPPSQQWQIGTLALERESGMGPTVSTAWNKHHPHPRRCAGEKYKCKAGPQQALPRCLPISPHLVQARYRGFTPS